MPPNPVSNQNQEKIKFDSWKEIARYLDRHITTCQRWEKEFGLPVHRLDESSRARVFAFKEEIDIWLEEKAGDIKFKPRRRLFKFLKISPIFLFITISCSASLALLLYILIKPPSRAADFRIQGSKLIILDKRQKEMWTYETGVNTLMPDRHYREHFQEKQKIKEHYYLPHLIIKDINGDFHREVLFTIWTTDRSGKDSLMCLDKRGERLWDFKVGGKKVFGGKSYTDDYQIHGFDIGDIDSRGNPEILIIASHKSSFPCQIVILDSEGQLVREYWNSGQIKDYAFLDLDNDGMDEIFLSGINEEWNRPCCAVLDYFCFDGASPQTQDYYRCSDVCPHREKYYFLMPINAVDPIIGKTRCIKQIEINKNTPDEFINFKSLLIYTFNNKMEHVDMDFSYRFQMDHEKALRNGRIDKNLYQIRAELLNEGPLYFDGLDWTPKPTQTQYWTNKGK